MSYRTPLIFAGGFLVLWILLFVSSMTFSGWASTTTHIGSLIVSGCIGWSLERAGSAWFAARRQRRLMR